VQSLLAQMLSKTKRKTPLKQKTALDLKVETIFFSFRFNFFTFFVAHGQLTSILTFPLT